MATNNVRLPNGNILYDVDPKLNKAQIMQLAIEQGVATQQDFAPKPQVNPEVPLDDDSDTGFISNVTRGALNRNQSVAANLLDYIGEGIKEKTKHVIEGVAKYERGSELTDQERENLDVAVSQTDHILKELADETRQHDWGYEQRYTWDRLKEDPNLMNLFLYSAETMGVSAPDMIYTMTIPSLYALARIEEIGDERAVNKALTALPPNATKEQIEKALEAQATMLEKAEAVPTVGAVILSEKLGLERLFNPKAVKTGADWLLETGKEGLVQAGIEGLQETGELVGKKLGTGQEITAAEAGETFLAGSAGGGPFGGGVRAVTATAQLGKQKLSEKLSESGRLAEAEAIEQEVIAAEKEIEAQNEAEGTTETSIPDVDPDEVGDTLSVNEAAALAGVSPTTIRRRIKAGKLNIEEGRLNTSDVIAEFGQRETVVEEEVTTEPAAETEQVAEGEQTQAQDETITREEQAAPQGMPETITAGLGSFKTKPLGNKDFHRETSLEEVGFLIREVFANNAERGGVYGGRGLDMSDNPDLALGQGRNKGVNVVFDGNLVSGKQNIPPGQSPQMAEQFGTNYLADYINRDAIKEVRLPEGSKLGGAARVFFKQNFEKVETKNGQDVYRRKTSQKTPPNESPLDNQEERTSESVSASGGYVGSPPKKGKKKEKNNNPRFDDDSRKVIGYNAFGVAITKADMEASLHYTHGTYDGTTLESAQESGVQEMPGYIGMIQSESNANGQPKDPTPTRLANGMQGQKRVTRKFSKDNLATYDSALRLFRRMVGNRIYHGGLKRGAALGTYTHNTGAIRNKEHNNPEVLAHEVGHFLDFNKSVKIDFTSWRERNSEVRKFSYTDRSDLVSSEGFAEFVRLWMTQYPKLKRAAPNAVAEFEALLQQDKKLWGQMLELQEVCTSFYAQGADLNAMAKVGDHRTILDKLEDFLYNNSPTMVRQRVMDGVLGMKYLRNQLLDQSLISKLPAHLDPYKLYKIARGGAESIYETILYKGPIRINEQTGQFESTGVRGLHQILLDAKTVKTGKKSLFAGSIGRDREYSREKWEDFVMYLIARRARELRERSKAETAKLKSQGSKREIRREKLISEQNQEAMLEKAQKWKDKDGTDFEAIAEEYQRFNDAMLDFYVQCGYISNEQRDIFKEQNKDYIPFYRLRENALLNKDGRKSIHTPLHGGTQNIAYVEENITDGLRSHLQNALEARAKRATFDMIRNSEDGAYFASKRKMESEVVTVNNKAMAARIAKLLSEMGIGLDEWKGNLVNNKTNETLTSQKDMADFLEANPHLMTMYSSMVAPRGDDTIVESVIVDKVDNEGNPYQEVEYWEVHEPLLLDMFGNLNPQSYGVLMDVSIAAKTLMTRSVTSFLEFITGNAVRDTLSAWYLSHNGFIPFVDTGIGMYHYLKKTPIYEEAVMNGLLFSTNLHDTTREGRSRAQLDLPYRDGAWGYWDRAKNFLNEYDRIISASEYGTRIGEYRRARKKGKSPADAAFDAREISGDFSTRGGGVFARTYMRTVPFMNASMVGMERTARGFADEVRLYQEMVDAGKATNSHKEALAKRFEIARQTMIIKAAPTVAASLLLSAFNQRNNEEDERYRELTHDQLSRYWWVFYDPNEPPLKLRKPFEFGLLFGTIPEIMMNYIRDKDGDAMADAMTLAVADTFGFLGDAPGIVQSGLEWLKNETFTGAPVVGRQDEKMIGEQSKYQYTERTPQVYKLIGKELNVSPVKLQHFTKGFFRYAEAWMSDITTAMLWPKEQFGNRPFTTNPLDRVYNQFVGRDVEYRTKFTENFWQLHDLSYSIKTAQDKIIADHVEREGGVNIEELEKKYPEFQGGNLILGAVTDTLTAGGETLGLYNDMLRMIQTNNEKVKDPLTGKEKFKLSSKDKEDAMNEIYKKRNELVKIYVKALKPIVKEKDEQYRKKLERELQQQVTRDRARVQKELQQIMDN